MKQQGMGRRLSKLQSAVHQPMQCTAPCNLYNVTSCYLRSE